MSRKDYAKIAEVLAGIKERRLSSTDSAYISSAVSVWEDTVRGIADALSEDNPRFDYNRFYKAAGYERK